MDIVWGFRWPSTGCFRKVLFFYTPTKQYSQKNQLWNIFQLFKSSKCLSQFVSNGTAVDFLQKWNWFVLASWSTYSFQSYSLYLWSYLTFSKHPVSIYATTARFNFTGSRADARGRVRWLTGRECVCEWVVTLTQPAISISVIYWHIDTRCSWVLHRSRLLHVAAVVRLIFYVSYLKFR